MATLRQLAANRLNAQKSTGPTTEAGKLKSRANSLTHGLGAIHVPLPHEDPSVFAEMRAELIQSWLPANAQELLLVDMIAHAARQMSRTARMEAGLMRYEVESLRDRHNLENKPGSNDDAAVAITLGHESQLNWEILGRYETRAQSSYYRAIETLRKLQKDRLDRPLKELRANYYLKQTIAPTPKLAPFCPEPLTPAKSENGGSGDPLPAWTPAPRALGTGLRV